MGFRPIGIQVSLPSCIKVYGAHILICTHTVYVVFAGHNFLVMFSGFCCGYVFCPHTVHVTDTCAWLIIVSTTLLHEFPMKYFNSKFSHFNVLQEINHCYKSHIYKCHIPALVSHCLLLPLCILRFNITMVTEFVINTHLPLN